MASWKEERDRLVAQTLAFVQQVAAAHPRQIEISPIEPTVPTPWVDTRHALPDDEQISTASGSEIGAPGTTQSGQIEIVQAQVLTAAMLPNHALYSTLSERADITQRVASFKARQSQIGREREAYYETMQARIRTSLRPDVGNVSDPDRL